MYILNVFSIGRRRLQMNNLQALTLYLFTYRLRVFAHNNCSLINFKFTHFEKEIATTK